MQKLDLTICRLAAENAQAKPRHQFDAIVRGFKIHIVYRKLDCHDKYVFEANILYKRNYGGTRYAYADTVDELMIAVTNLVEDALTTFANGGDYTEN